MTEERRTIDDLVVLGRGAPDTMHDGRVTVCVAGWSSALGFVRIYPTRYTSPLKQWSVVSVPVERNPTDSRPESWKIQGSSAEWDRLDGKIRVLRELKKPERRRLVPTLETGCVATLNSQRRSLGVIHPTALAGYLSDRADVDQTVQTTLFGGTLPNTKENYPHQPRLKYQCGTCGLKGGHDQQIIEWGCYEWFRKNPGKEAQVFENLQIANPEWEKYLLVGNQNNHRTSFIVIGVIRWKKGPAPD